MRAYACRVGTWREGHAWTNDRDQKNQFVAYRPIVRHAAARAVADPGLPQCAELRMVRRGGDARCGLTAASGGRTWHCAATVLRAGAAPLPGRGHRRPSRAGADGGGAIVVRLLRCRGGAPRAAEGAERYAPLAAAVSSAFRPAVVERFGALCDAFVGVVREVCGDRDRDALLHDDVTFSQSSRTTWAAGMLAACRGDG